MSFIIMLFFIIFSYMVIMKSYVFSLMVWLEVFILLCGKLMLTVGVLGGSGGPLMLIFMVSFAVCEAVMALSCLVNMSYCVENFNLKSLDMLKC